ncbi:MAG: sugar ABC transporter ATP-binding protein [Ignisphaera sp.]
MLKKFKLFNFQYWIATSKITVKVMQLNEKRVILSAENIWKRFPGVVAVRNVSMKVREAEILGLVGENGAGKSTLLKILTGVIRKDSGKITWLGRTVEFSSPLEALKHGIMYIPQDIVLVWNLSLAENIFLGTEKGWLFSPKSESEEIEIARQLFKELGIDIDPRIKGKDVGAAVAQITLIARALYFKAKLVAFDEPTSALGPFEVEQLLKLMLKLRSMGISIIFVSHKIEEVMRVADRIVVMRDGEIVKEFSKEQFDMNEIIKAMIAREVREFFPKEHVEIGDKILEVRNLSDATGFIKNVSFYVRRGEILGIYGIVGSGRTEMAQTLIGYRPRASGEIILEGKVVDIKKPSDAIANGIVYLPEDWRQALVYLMSIKENISLPIASSLKIFEMGLISPINLRKEHQIASSFIERLRIVPRDPHRRTMYLSGGNRQKVAIAKLLATGAKVLILDEPTHGVDVGAKVEIRKLMVEAAKEGKAIILISSELPEVLNMSDRILVMRNGTIVAEFSRGEATEQKIAEAAILAR